MRIERVDLPAFAGSASRVLREAWEPTCVNYSPEYLRWQFESPGDRPAAGVAAFDGDEVVGFFGSVPRRLRLGGERFEARLLSFLAVRPAWQGPLGVPFFLYKALLDAADGPRGPLVAFVQPNSVSERILLPQLRSRRYRVIPLGACRNHVGRGGRRDAGYTCVEAVDRMPEYLSIVPRCDEGGRLLSDPGPAPIAHSKNDPRGRTVVVVLGPGGEPVGGATVGVSEVMSPTGLESVATLEGLFLPEPSAPLLQALTRFAVERWGGRLTSKLVTIPNVQGIDPAVLLAAGIRATPGVFLGYLFLPEESPPLPDVSSTNVDVV